MDKSVPQRVDCSGGREQAVCRTTSVVKGARLIILFNDVSCNVRRARVGEVSIRVECNQGIRMDNCGSKVDATIRIETGDMGNPHYTKYEFDCSFGNSHQEEFFEYKKGQVFRNRQLVEEKSFNMEVFSGFLQYTIIVKTVKGSRVLSDKNEWDYLSPDCFHDKVVVLDDGTRFYVLSQILSASSAFFRNVFNNSNFDESKQDEVTIGGVGKKAFQTMLKFIYPFRPYAEDLCESDYGAVEALLEMADRFDAPLMMDALTKWIMEEYWSERKGLEMMKWADQYDLLELQNAATDRYVSRRNNLHQVIHDHYDYFQSLPWSAREKVYHVLYLQQRQAAALTAASETEVSVGEVELDSTRESDSRSISSSIAGDLVALFENG